MKEWGSERDNSVLDSSLVLDGWMNAGMGQCGGETRGDQCN